MLSARLQAGLPGSGPETLVPALNEHRSVAECVRHLERSSRESRGVPRVTSPFMRVRGTDSHPQSWGDDSTRSPPAAGAELVPPRPATVQPGPGNGPVAQRVLGRPTRERARFRTCRYTLRCGCRRSMYRAPPSSTGGSSRSRETNNIDPVASSRLPRWQIFRYVSP